MRAPIIFGLLVCIASVGYAHADDEKRETSPKTSQKAGADPKTGTKAETAKAENKPLSAAESGVLNDLHASNLTEIAAGKLGQKSAVAPAVKAYARMLVKDHTAADAKVRALAKRRSVTLVSTARDISNLEAHSGASFDRAFLAMMVTGHGEAIEKVKRAQQTCEDTEVRKLLDETLPRLEKHRDQALKLHQESDQHARAN